MKIVRGDRGNSIFSGAKGPGFQTDWKPLLLALALTAALGIAGDVLMKPREDQLWQTVWIGCFFLVVLCYLAAFLFNRRIARLNKRKLPQIHEALLQKQRDVEADYLRAERRLRRSIRFARFWYALVLLVTLFAVFLIGPALAGSLHPSDATRIFSWLMGCCVVWGLLCPWFNKAKDEPPKLELSETDYPAIFGLVRQAASTAGCTMPVRVCAGGESVSIFRGPKEIRIYLDAATCALYTKNELYNVLLHEFAHEFNEDTVRSMRISRELAIWGSMPEGLLPRIGAYPLSLSAGWIAIEQMYFELFATRHKEKLADACAVRWGDAQTFVNSLAKIAVWAIFEGSANVPEISLYAEYAGETPPQDIPANALRVFRRLLPQMRGEWRRLLDVELPMRISSHPTFRERREAFGVTQYSFEDVETDAAYLAEMEALLTTVGKAIAEQLTEDYEKKRKAYYLDRKELIDRAKAVTEWSAETIDDRIEMAQAVSMLEPALEETIILSILSDDPENAYGFMLLGCKRFRENDPACVPLLQTAAQKNNNFVDAAYDKIGHYARINGEQALLEQYRAEVAGAIQETIDTDESMHLRWNGRDRLSENDLPREQFEANLAAILERTEGQLTRLYTVKKPISDGDCYYYFLEFSQELSEEERSRLYEQVFLYLDYCPDQYYLSDVTGKPKARELLLRQVPGCEIYTKE